MKAQPLEIKRIPFDVDFEEFERDYFDPEVPVILEGVGPAIQRTADLDIDTIHEKIVDTGLATVNTYWFEGDADAMRLLVDTPEIVKRLLENSHVRKNCCRLWLNGAGNLTPSHYDGNMLYVFNLQLKGSKFWRLVSPHTPLRNYPFSRAAVFGEGGTTAPTQAGLDCCEFTLEEGEMLFLPPFWHHSVQAMAEKNINVNWVATKKSGWLESKTLDREKELLRIALNHHKLTGRTKLLDQVMGAGIEGYMENFAGVGWPFVEEAAADIGQMRAMLRLVRELGAVPAAIRDRKALKAQFGAKPMDSLERKATPANEPASASASPPIT